MARRSMRIRLQVAASIRARLGMMRWREGGGGEENETVCIMNREYSTSIKAQANNNDTKKPGGAAQKAGGIRGERDKKTNTSWRHGLADPHC